MPKERSINPAQAERKKEKAKAIKKGKAQVATLRDQKLAKKNPERIQKQIDELKAIEEGGGKLTGHEKGLLEGLEREVKSVRKAREGLGDAAPKLGRPRDDSAATSGRGGFGERGGGRAGYTGLGKRRRDEGILGESEGEEDGVPEEVRRIPLPRDTPPPVGKELLDRWYQARRDRAARNAGSAAQAPSVGGATGGNTVPLGRGAGQNERRGRHMESEPSAAPSVVGDGSAAEQVEKKIEAQTTYEAKPVLRDLRKEATAFVPSAVRKKMDMGKGVGGLVEPEEADRLEREGYRVGGKGQVGLEEVADEDG